MSALLDENQKKMILFVKQNKNTIFTDEDIHLICPLILNVVQLQLISPHHPTHVEESPPRRKREGEEAVDFMIKKPTNFSFSNSIEI